MPEAPARVWLRQSMADWNASRRLHDDADTATFCQAIGKHQQAVEKAVKGILAALRDRGVLRVATPRGHLLRDEMIHIVSAVRRLPSSGGTFDLIQRVQSLFNFKNTAEIDELCGLAPKWPSPGALFPRNTEYPFETAANVWTAPADDGSFKRSDLRKYRHLTVTVVEAAHKIVSAAER